MLTLASCALLVLLLLLLLLPPCLVLLLTTFGFLKKKKEPKHHGCKQPRTYVNFVLVDSAYCCNMIRTWYVIRSRPARCIADTTTAGTEVAPHYHQLLLLLL